MRDWICVGSQRRQSKSDKIRLSDAAKAAGTTQKALRNWFTRYADRGVSLAAHSNGKRKWMEFSIEEVICCGIAQRLVDFGMSAPMAFAAARDITAKEWTDLSAHPKEVFFIYDDLGYRRVNELGSTNAAIYLNLPRIFSDVMSRL